MMPEPLKSALSLGDVEDTSLALPSDHDLRSAQQRVLEQVYTIKRSKSKYSSKSVSGLTSPTSPDSDSVFHDFKRSSASALSGPSINRGGTMTSGAKQRQSFVRKSINSRNSSVHMSTGSKQDRSLYAAANTLPARPRPNSLYGAPGTQSAPDLGFKPALNGSTAQRQASGHSSQWVEKKYIYPPHQPQANGTFGRVVNTGQGGTMQQVKRRSSSLHSNGESRMSMTRMGLAGVSGVNTERLITDMTMKEAVEYLFSPDESHQLCGAAYIQHSTYTDEKAKQEVLTLKGIPPLINLLNSPSPQVQETVAAALRNAVFKNQPNKEEVQRSGGIQQAVQLLGETDTETQKHLTGLLWNLSSADNIKPDLLRFALPTLTEKVIVFSTSTDNSTSVAPEVFYNATACLRNLSSSKLANRQAMRNCKGLIDSLMQYMDNCISAETPDNESLENCVCILHNLTYQLETEMPSLFTKINALASYAHKRTSSSDAGPIGCFSSQSQKIPQENVFDYPVMEDNNPKGASWLFHSKALQMFLNLLSSSERDATLEASCGALQNLTANEGIVSSVLSDTIVQKLNGLKYISPLLQSSNPALQNSAVALLGNLSRSTRTNKAMESPTAGRVSESGLTQGEASPQFDSRMATALQSAHTLLKADPDMGKGLLNNGLINSLNHMSQNMLLPKSSTAAGMLLHSLWSDKNIQSFLKSNLTSSSSSTNGVTVGRTYGLGQPMAVRGVFMKTFLRTQGMNKKSFVNDITSAAFKSLQVVD